MMTEEEHPAYSDEKRHLDSTLSIIRKSIEDHAPAIGLGGDNRAAQESRRVQLRRQEKMKAAQEKAYFGRVDLLEDERSGPEVFYIGKYAIPGTNVYAWAGTLAGDLYYKQRSHHTDGRLLLKRTLEIHFAELSSISDEYVDTEMAELYERDLERFTDALLLKLLEGPRGSRLREIVATIQRRQYEIIQASRDRLLMVQGVTGSGKTEVALHRLAYLLYQHRDSGDFVAENLLMLGPSRIFLGYISNVLPNLGERRIQHRTFGDWMVERLGTEVKYEPQETSLEMLLDPEIPLAERAMVYRNAHNKSSLRMAEMLERYVDILHDDIMAGRQSLVSTFRLPQRVRDPAPSVSRQAQRSVEQMRELLDQVRSFPLNERPDRLKERLVRSLGQELLGQFELGPYQADDLRPQVTSRVQAQVDEYFGDWRRENVAFAYRRLLRNPQLLHQAGSESFSVWDLELLSLDAPTPQQPFRFSDLAPLLYLKGLLDGHDGRSYDHIVIDEAQDISPLYFKLLFNHTRSGSMTALGDLAQGIYPFHGARQWEDLTEAVPGDRVLRETIGESYRSTKEIMEFSNALLTRIGVSGSQLAQPIERSGPVPSLHDCSSRVDQAKTIVKLLRTEQDSGRQAIAIICKTAKGCQRLMDELRGSGIGDIQLILDQEATYAGETAILPCYFAKGLEFDTVILADSDSTTYQLDELSARLLYVAITRASHSLYVCWIGTLTPLLDTAEAHLEMRSLLNGLLEPRPVTIEQYAATDSKFDADRCVERLAGEDRLEIMSGGRIDETVLTVFLASRERGPGAVAEKLTGGIAADD